MRPRGRAPSARFEVSPGPAPRSAVLAPPAWLAEPRLGVVARLAIDLGAVADTAAGGGIDECCRALAFLQLRTTGRRARAGVEALDRAFGLGGEGAEPDADVGTGTGAGAGATRSHAAIPGASSSLSGAGMSPALLEALFSPAPLCSSGEAGLVGDPRHVSLLVLWRLVEARAPARHLRAAFDAVNAARRRAKTLGREDATNAESAETHERRASADGSGQNGVSGLVLHDPPDAAPPRSGRAVSSVPNPASTSASAPTPPSDSASASVAAATTAGVPSSSSAFAPLPSALSPSPHGSSRAGSALAEDGRRGASDRRGASPPAGALQAPSALRPSSRARGSSAAGIPRLSGGASGAAPPLRRDPDLSSHSCSPERPLGKSLATGRGAGCPQAASEDHPSPLSASAGSSKRLAGVCASPAKTHGSSHRPPTPAAVRLPLLGPDVAGTTATSTASPARSFSATPAPHAARKERVPTDPHGGGRGTPGPASPLGQAPLAAARGAAGATAAGSPGRRTSAGSSSRGAARGATLERALYADAGVGLTPVIVACLLLERAADRLDAAAAAVGLACGRPPRGLPPVPDALLPPPGWPLLTAYALEFVGSLLAFGVAVPPTVGLVVTRGLLAQGRAHELRATLGALPALRSRELADWLTREGARTEQSGTHAVHSVPRSPIAPPCLPSLAHDLLCSLGDRGAAAELLLRCGRVEEAVHAARHYRLPGMLPGRLAIEAATKGRPDLLPGLVRVSRAGPGTLNQPQHPSLQDVLRDLDRRFPDVGIAAWAEGTKA